MVHQFPSEGLRTRKPGKKNRHCNTLPNTKLQNCWPKPKYLQFGFSFKMVQTRLYRFISKRGLKSCKAFLRLRLRCDKAMRERSAIREGFGEGCKVEGCKISMKCLSWTLDLSCKFLKKLNNP